MALGSVDAYYRTMAEELASLSRKGAEISWASDAAPRPTARAQRKGRELASTGRLPKASKPSQAKRAPSAASNRREGTASVPRAAPALPWPSPAPGVVEVSTRKPSYLMEVKTRPAVLTQRGAQPRSQLRGEGAGIQRPRARRLQLSRARELAVVPEPVEELPRSPSAASTSHLSRTPTHSRNAKLLPDEASDAGAIEAADESASVSSAAGASLVVGLMDLPLGSSAIVEEPVDFEPPSVPVPATTPPPAAAATAPPAPPVQLKARLASVTDLQLILPERVETPAPLEMRSRAPGVDEQDVSVEKPSPPAAGPPPMVRPVLRSLIADVIEEMRVPEYEPAEVIGGQEVRPFLGPRSQLPKRALHEDLCGHDMGRAPPPYIQGPPPPYETQPKKVPNSGVTAQAKAAAAAAAAAEQFREQASSLTRVQEALQAQTAALVQAQTQAHVQLQAITEAQATMQAQREESQQLTRNVQQHAEDARRRLEDAASRQAESLQRGATDLQQQLADVVRQELQRGAVAAQQHLTSAVQQSIQLAQSAPATASQASPAPQVIVHQQPSLETQLYPAMVDGLRRLEVRLEQQATQLAQAQSEERATQLAALRSLQVTPRAVHAIVPPQPPPPPAPLPALEPTVETADREAQVSMPPPREHEERVARFTEYLLHGPPGQARQDSKLIRPLPTDLVWIDTMLADALGVAASPAETTSESMTGMEDPQDHSVGEISYTTWREQLLSPGELPSEGELTSGSLAVELFAGGEAEPVDREPGEQSGSAGEVSGLSISEDPSYGEVLVSDGLVSDDVSPASIQEDPEACRQCGNVFLPDSNFCRRCGCPRGELEPGELLEAVRVSELPRGGGDATEATSAGGEGSAPGPGATSPELGELSEGEEDSGVEVEDGLVESS